MGNQVFKNQGSHSKINKLKNLKLLITAQRGTISTTISTF